MNKQVNDLLAGIAAEGEQHEPVPVVDGEIVEGEGTPIVPIETEGQGTEPPVEGQGPEGETEGEANLNEPVVEETEGDEPPVEGELVFEDWDDDDVEGAEGTPVPDTATFMEALKEVAGDDVKDVDGLKEFITNLKHDNSALKEQVSTNPLENVPEILKEAVELSKEGGADYLELLKITSMDYTKLDPATLAESEIRQYFYKDDGAFDADGFVDYIDNVPEKELEIRGRQRIDTLVQEQTFKKNAYLDNVKRQTQVNNDAIERAVGKMDKVGKFKLNDGHKLNLIKSMKDGGYKNVLEPRNSEGEINYNQLAEDVFIKQNFAKMVAIMETGTKNKLKGEIIQEIGNQTVVGQADKSVHSPEGGNDPLDALIGAAKQSVNRNSINTYYEQINK